MYLYIEVIINFNHFAKGVDELHEICKFPHIPEALQKARFFGRLSGIVLIRLLPGTLARGHVRRDEGWPG